MKGAEVTGLPSSPWHTTAEQQVYNLGAALARHTGQEEGEAPPPIFGEAWGLTAKRQCSHIGKSCSSLPWCCNWWHSLISNLFYMLSILHCQWGIKDRTSRGIFVRLSSRRWRLEMGELSALQKHPLHTPSYKEPILGSKTYFFFCFLPRLSGNDRSWVISNANFGPTAFNLRYDC
jgi:hypothetical protein